MAEVPRWREARYGLRAVRVGEAQHPGPGGQQVKHEEMPGEAASDLPELSEAAHLAETVALAALPSQASPPEAEPVLMDALSDDDDMFADDPLFAAHAATEEWMCDAYDDQRGGDATPTTAQPAAGLERRARTLRAAGQMGLEPFVPSRAFFNHSPHNDGLNIL